MFLFTPTGLNAVVFGPCCSTTTAMLVISGSSRTVSFAPLQQQHVLVVVWTEQDIMDKTIPYQYPPPPNTTSAGHLRNVTPQGSGTSLQSNVNSSS
jgi:hypothetical protein